MTKRCIIASGYRNLMFVANNYKFSRERSIHANRFACCTTGESGPHVYFCCCGTFSAENDRS